jgi:threonine dehydrogenase-like Zn-dependent dehydrogenase
MYSLSYRLHSHHRAPRRIDCSGSPAAILIDLDLAKKRGTVSLISLMEPEAVADSGATFFAAIWTR